MQLIWTEPAEADLEDIEAYIAEDNSPAVAFDVIFRVIDTAQQLLTEHPESGRVGRIQNTRELVIDGTPYLVVYRIRDEIEALRVLHGAQRWPPGDE